MLTRKSMGNEKTIKSLLIRVEKLEKVVFGKNSKKAKNPEPKTFKGATGGLRLLLSKGFFDRKRTFGEIKQGLADHDYHYSNQAVQTPLNNLSKTSGPLVSFREDGKKVYAKRK